MGNMNQNSKNDYTLFEEDGRWLRSRVSGLITLIVIAIAALAMFFFPEGRHIIRLSGYLFFAMIVAGLGLLIVESISELKAISKEMANAEQMKKWAEAPYEVEPASEREASVMSDEPMEVKPDEISENSTSERKEEISEEQKTRPVGAALFLFDSSALQNLAGNLYGAFLVERFDKKYLNLAEHEVPIVLNHEISVLENHEKESFYGYTAYVASNFEVVQTDLREGDVIERENSMLDYLKQKKENGEDIFLVTDNPHLTQEALEQGYSVLSSEELCLPSTNQ